MSQRESTASGLGFFRILAIIHPAPCLGFSAGKVSPQRLGLSGTAFFLPLPVTDRGALLAGFAIVSHVPDKLTQPRQNIHDTLGHQLYCMLESEVALCRRSNSAAVAQG